MSLMGALTTRRLTGRVWMSLSLWIFVLTVLALAIHPIPECAVCEFPHAWGRNDAAYTRDSRLIAAWLILTSMLAGFWDIKRNWPVPAAILVAHLLTQPIGGVPWWSLWKNEGPMILLLGIPTGAASLMVGYLIRLGVPRKR